MARLRDTVPVLRRVGPWMFAKRVWQQVNEDGVLVWASALAYSWLFAIFPFLIFLLGLVPYLPGSRRNSAEHRITAFCDSMLGKSAPIINENIQYVMHRPHTGWMGLGLAVALWAASGGMSMTMAALDQCYDIKHGRPFYKQRPIAIVLTIVVVFMLLPVFVLLPIGEQAEKYLVRQHYMTGMESLVFGGARYGLSLLLMLAILASVYYWGISIRQHFRLFSPGALFSIVVWVLLDVMFRLYIDNFNSYDKTYGTVGGAAILLFFFYIDAVVLLIGAEINSEIDYEVLGVPQGSRDFTVAAARRGKPDVSDSRDDDR